MIYLNIKVYQKLKMLTIPKSQILDIVQIVLTKGICFYQYQKMTMFSNYGSFYF